MKQKNHEKKILPVIIERIKKFKNVANDSEVAELLKMKTQTLATAKMRDSIPYENLIAFCDEEELSLEWLLKGRGSACDSSNVDHKMQSEVDAQDKFEQVIQWLKNNPIDLDLIFRLLKSKREMTEVFKSFKENIEY